MSVQTSTSLLQYSGHLSDAPYPVSFRFLENSHLKVVVTDADGSDHPLVLDTDYTVSGAGDAHGGTVSTAQQWSPDYTVTISRDVPATQLTSYAENSEFPAASHERALDKLTMLAQQNSRARGNTLRLPDSRADIPPLYPQATTVIGFDGAANPITYDSAALVAFLNLTQAVTDSPTKTFADAGARAAALPEFLGQVGVQVDDKSLWISNAITVGAWQPVISGTSYNNDAFVIVQTNTTATSNGMALLMAYAAVKTLRPGGNDLSATNRAVLIVPPGDYDLGSANLLLDAEFVDVVGMTTNRRAQYIHSITATSNEGTICQTANDVVIQNLYLANFCNDDGSGSSSTSAAYFPSSNLSATRLRNVEFLTLGAGSTGPFATRVGITYSGTYEDLSTTGVLAGGTSLTTTSTVASGTFTRCQGGHFAFGGGSGCSVTGTFFDCTGQDDSFGGNGGTIGATAVLINCRKTGTNLTDSTTITAGARITNFHDPAGVQYYPTYPTYSGAVVQKVYAEYTGRGSFNSQIPLDDTVPQNSEGAQVLTATITPKFSNSKILITFQGFAVGGNMVTALFRGSVPSAIAASDAASINGSSSPCVVGLTHLDSPGTTTAITYAIRAGSSSMHFNGNSSIRWFGTTAKATLILEEIKS